MNDKESQQLELLKTLQGLYEQGGTPLTLDLARNLHLDHAKLVGLIKSLEMMGKVTTVAKNHTVYKLTTEGEEVVHKGSPEFRLMQRISESGPQPADELRQTAALGLNAAMKMKAVQIRDGVVHLASNAPKNDDIRTLLTRIKREEEISGVDETEIKDLTRRKLVSKNTQTIFEIKKTDKFSTEIEKLGTDLTKDMLLSGSWKDTKFKPYNFNAAGIVPRSGSVHPLMQTSAMFRNILIQMGYSEMPTRRPIESSFWNFDALFQAQTHPCRDAHDTFFMKSPAMAATSTGQPGERPSLEYFNKVKSMHESGDNESLGWQCSWSPSEANKLLLRTHTTAISSQMLYALGEDYQKTGIFTPKRWFSIDRVYRNETLDATHLAEFFQVEGVVAEKGASLSDLMGHISNFYAKIGITQLKYKPAYNPYTEPSMEIFGYHPLLQKWTEIGNSGVFRPEMLRPMGLPDDVGVLGFGLSLERPTMISSGVRDIRSLVGPKSKLSII
eukprot:Protomagalhaensia_sp_Gyna_25__4474@NODE_40_length_6583_cov_138_691015_g29_i0_p2_GENE_NODE_40_length_6583_cov_138_691015_g29_i0NODE_40_length_6583_cov_138_691015_g29_i0_p2_ORF_typecomplete_len499_score77_39tRNAsynt_2d/PF01409_20/4_9e75PheRS_DBD1/PF18552_1/6_1e10tRNA_synthFbeta/PF17759_1/8_5e02tRNA_synthFbeta/PF17759_1/0_0001MarR/PF01047_22/0_011MarR/PF01047_22/54MarR/PF01047_22/2_7e03tRNAsynt_2/PF00152_20/0_0039tRNAsynt_2/PF00152_20/44PheRS_DBD3/PF18553_1/0_082PheRS_DBD3/PF18553_1/60HTH_45/PF1494